MYGTTPYTNSMFSISVGVAIAFVIRIMHEWNLTLRPWIHRLSPCGMFPCSMFTCDLVPWHRQNWTCVLISAHSHRLDPGTLWPCARHIWCIDREHSREWKCSLSAWRITSEQGTMEHVTGEQSVDMRHKEAFRTLRWLFSQSHSVLPGHHI